MSTLAVGAGMLILAGLFYWLKVLPATRAILAFIGTCIVTGGLFGSLMSRAAHFVANFTDTLTGKIFGVGIPGVLVIILGVIFVHDLLPKGGGASKRTMWVGLALAACLVAGLSSFQALNQLPANVQQGVTNIQTGH